ncbi:hypothetical protein BDP27DRAFT_1369432 [Rhodocollybia butyracea]|uniref:Uncharacterized protein n=1 Tax=Rhodocollybia butyracea TaxID=206335 RepID=A0A9P5U0U3_9AGAR|nr:hypothetical protein BDP27DRAFT_1369432 [Rhodocollybia butyracea]
MANKTEEGLAGSLEHTALNGQKTRQRAPTKLKNRRAVRWCYGECPQRSSHMETRVISAAGETLASWVWKELRSDKLTLGKAAPVSMNTWLRKSTIPFHGLLRPHPQWKGHTVSPKYHIPSTFPLSRSRF